MNNAFSIEGRKTVLSIVHHPSKDDLCNPCGKNCSDQFCDNWKCAIGCADGNFSQRVYNPDKQGNEGHYRRHEIIKFEEDSILQEGFFFESFVSE